jgi:hypothetical protein
MIIAFEVSSILFSHPIPPPLAEGEGIGVGVRFIPYE